jgi:hypothetical protein
VNQVSDDEIDDVIIGCGLPEARRAWRAGSRRCAPGCVVGGGDHRQPLLLLRPAVSRWRPST